MITLPRTKPSQSHKVLRAAGLSPHDIHDAEAVQALYEANQPYMVATVASDTDDSDA
jgi:hypothetical protein